MARLRYAGLTGSIGSSGLTSGATSHTFTAALTYSNGITVPTLSGSDYFMLSILDSSGNLSEIVKVTAYSSSTGAATIVRAQEGTIGVSHASGDKVTMAVYATDFAAVPTIKTSSENHGFGSNATITLPSSGFAADDTLVLFVGSDYGTNGTPAGWQMVETFGTSYHSSAILMKAAVAGDLGATVTVPLGGGSNFECIFAAVSASAISAMHATAGSNGSATAYSKNIFDHRVPVGSLVLQFVAARNPQAAPSTSPAGTTFQSGTNTQDKFVATYYTTTTPGHNMVGSCGTSADNISVAFAAFN